VTAGFPDVEDALCELLDILAPTGTATDEDFTIPIRVNRTGGQADRLGLQDAAIVTVTCFTETRSASQALNARVRMTLAGQADVPTAAGYIDSISEQVAPIPTFDPNPDERRVESVWTVVSRLQDVPA